MGATAATNAQQTSITFPTLMCQRTPAGRAGTSRLLSSKRDSLTELRYWMLMELAILLLAWIRCITNTLELTNTMLPQFYISWSLLLCLASWAATPPATQHTRERAAQHLYLVSY